jgi:hypothetical protein
MSPVDAPEEEADDPKQRQDNRDVEKPFHHEAQPNEQGD